MRISDWSSDVCSSDLAIGRIAGRAVMRVDADAGEGEFGHVGLADQHGAGGGQAGDGRSHGGRRGGIAQQFRTGGGHLAGRIEEVLHRHDAAIQRRSEEHTPELQSLMRNSYAVFCLKKKNSTPHSIKTTSHNTSHPYKYSI